MPSSYAQNIFPIIKAIGEGRPESVLDIGIGRGKYGFLIKEYYPKVKVDGVEVFEPYITDLQRKIYNHIFTSNALKMELGQYDLYLLIDIIEHWDKEEALGLIDKLLSRGGVIIATPKGFIKQGMVFGNAYEIHKSYWNIKDFKNYKYKDYSNELSLILYLYGLDR